MTKRKINAICSLAVAILSSASLQTTTAQTIAFTPERDAFDEASLLDLRYLNEDMAGESGWLTASSNGDFLRGDGEPIRFWAVNSNVKESGARPRPGWDQQELAHHARWLAKRGVNMVRTHAFINPQTTEDLTDVKQEEVEWIWKTVAEMKKVGIYTTVSPYWANNMKSNDGAWGTDWGGQHHALLFFDETLKSAYKSWLRYLFNTPTPILGGKMLSEEPALAIFQIQNEDSFLFWTINNLSGAPRERLEKLFGDWAINKYGSLEAAKSAWGNAFSDDDDLANGRLGMANIWNLTNGAGQTNQPRLDALLAFWTVTMKQFNAEIADFVENDLGCPVLINAGNWKTADTLLLNDSERYSYTANDIIGVNRYFSGVHVGPNDGWSIDPGDFYTNKSVLKDGALSFPINIKQVQHMPTIMSESTWAYPNEECFESPMLLSAYSSLTGFDIYYWFSSGVDDFEIPRSANGYKQDSQAKWICMTPDMAGQWPAAALAFRRHYIRRAEPVVVEHRSLQSLWQRRSPIIAETASFDPNRDTGNLPPDSPVTTGLNPYAFFVGPVKVEYDSNESNSQISASLDSFIEETGSGVRVSSATSELLLDTEANVMTIDTPKVQSMIAHAPASRDLQDVRIQSNTGVAAVTVISMDEKPVKHSAKILVQVGTHSRPTGWDATATTRTVENRQIDGFQINSVGSAPWQLQATDITVTFKDMILVSAQKLDANGLPVAELDITQEGGDSIIQLPQDTLYVIVKTKGTTYDEWALSQDWGSQQGLNQQDKDPDLDGLVNLLEYALNGNPVKFEMSPLAGMQLIDVAGQPHSELHYQVNFAAQDIQLQLERSADLMTWSPVEQPAEVEAGSLLSRLVMPIESTITYYRFVAR